MIVVVGGSGRLGRPLVARLLDAGRRVRVVARRPDRAADFAGPDVEVVQGDVTRPDTLTGALDGASVVVSAMHGLGAPERSVSPDRVDRLGNRALIDAAAASDADVVLVSVIGAAAEGNDLFAAKWAAEEYLRGSGVRWTVVRSAAFAEMWLDVLHDTAGRSGRPRVLGTGTNPINFVAVADVAAAVARACLDPGLRGRVIEVGGPADLTLEALARSLCRPGATPRHVPRAALRVLGELARPVHPGFARLARMGLSMDTENLRFDPAPSLAAYPWLTCSPVTLGDGGVPRATST